MIAGQHELTSINNQNKLGYLLSVLRGNWLPPKFTRNKYNRENYETKIISMNNGIGNETEEKTNWVVQLIEGHPKKKELPPKLKPSYLLRNLNDRLVGSKPRSNTVSLTIEENYRIELCGYSQTYHQY